MPAAAEAVSVRVCLSIVLAAGGADAASAGHSVRCVRHRRWSDRRSRALSSPKTAVRDGSSSHRHTEARSSCRVEILPSTVQSIVSVVCTLRSVGDQA